MFDSIDLVPVSQYNAEGAYVGIYRFLKKQRLLLEQLLLSLDVINLTPENTLVLSMCRDGIRQLMECNFGCIFENSALLRDRIYSAMRENTLSRELGEFVSSVVQVVRRLHPGIMVQVDESSTDSVDFITRPLSPSVSGSPPKEDGLGSGLLLCRICEQYVRLSQIEQHSICCVLACEGEHAVISLDDRIGKLREAISNSLLDGPWPGEEFESASKCLPLLHVVLILDLAMSADAKNIQSVADLKHCCSAISAVNISDPDNNPHDILARAIQLVQEKFEECESLSRAVFIQKSTTMTQSSSGSLTFSIADFDFLDRISSGAYARVFLGRKQTTGDIYAIKVTPKTSLKQKNEVKRILTEKDILLQLYNPFIVSFCMF
jgi:hypothetical protein